MTAKIIPFPLRLATQGKLQGPPAKVLAMRDHQGRPMARADREARAYELYVNASAIDELPGREDEAVGMYLEALALDPELALANTNLGNIFWRKGDAEGAIERYRRALDVDPLQPEANYNLGYTRLEQGDAKGAVPWLVKATQSDGRFADAWFNLGVAHETLRELGPMRAAFKRYLELEPTGVWAEMASESLSRGLPPKRRPRRRP